MTYSNEERMPLIDIIRDREYRCGAEVGVWKGVFSEFILQQTSVDKLFLIDSWSINDNIIPLSDGRTYVHEHGQTPETFEAAYQETEQRLQPFGNRAEIVRVRSPEAAKRFDDRTLDFVYIDAIHYALWLTEDIEAWLPKVRKGGMLVGDDFTGMFPDVSRVIKERFGEVYACGPTWLVEST